MSRHIISHYAKANRTTPKQIIVLGWVGLDWIGYGLVSQSVMDKRRVGKEDKTREGRGEGMGQDETKRDEMNELKGEQCLQFTTVFGIYRRV